MVLQYLQAPIVPPEPQKPVIQQKKEQAKPKPVKPNRSSQGEITKVPHPPKEEPSSPQQPSAAKQEFDWSSWEKASRHYSGGGYGVEKMKQRLSWAPEQGGYKGDRVIVQEAAQKYGVPMEIMWATYGMESGWGKISWKGGIIPYFGLTWDYPGRGTSGSFKKDANRAAQIWQELYRKYQTGA